MDKFSFFAPFSYMEKGTKNGLNGVIDVRIGGLISKGVKDFQGDNIGQDGLIFDLWKNGYGRIKYEHNKDPKYFIGYPLNVVKKGIETHVEGAIFATPGTAQYDIAQQAVGDLTNIMNWNRIHPDQPKRMGFSIEGGVLEKKGNKVTKSIVTHVVLTSTPVNPTTYAVLMKSFEAGHSVNSSEMTGGQAGRKQHLEGTHKNKTINIGDTILMNDLTKKEDVVTHLINKGFTEEKAKEEADNWEKRRKRKTNNDEKLEKSVKVIEETLEEIEKFAKSLDEDENIETFEKSFEKSIGKLNTAQPDPTDFLQVVGESNIEIRKSLNSNMENLARMQGMVLSVLKENLVVMKSIHNDLIDVAENSVDIVHNGAGMEALIKGLDPGVITQNLSQMQVADLDKNKNKDKGTQERVPKSIKVKTFLRKSLDTAKKDSDTNKIDIYNDAITRFESFGYKGLSKALRNEILEAIPEETPAQ